MKVYIANFGRENYAWPDCLARHEIVTMQDERVHDLWRDGDRKGYIDFCVANLKTMKGIAPTRPVAGRWFNLGSIVTESSGDMWLHQDGKHLWWTVTTDGLPIIEPGPDLKPNPDGPPNVYYYRKPAQPWSNMNRKGEPIEWKGLHPKAPDFLVTEATLQKLSDDYAGYALTLIEGGDLSPWHGRAEWKAKTEAGSRKQPVRTFSAMQIAFFNMANVAWDTALKANGQKEMRNVKNKDFGFANRDELAAYIADLYEAQEGLCAITGLTLQFRDGDDHQLCCSLDRIDSQGHYVPGNLQIVCKFINMWKSNRDDTEFRRLIEIVRGSSGF
ncbi:hypothetical protein [Sphingopyxis panaciterrulae]|uniref:Uncharacterized protein n=1 Tax=Sphingopyxis panaciterrulae TaxID=462372 RepID=A0A7W9EP68_9SPHN|nr:hypothetical protein [Sphingopyxis panaciterrulae]MBB5705222.1 hypothetical protein [Sphingopyxis panaciterrulae]